MPDPLSLSAREAARRIAEGRLSAEALVTACLERIAAREPMVGAWQYLDPEAALAAARRCDASAPSGPLHGVPIAVKDLIDTADMPTGYGSAIYAGHRPGGRRRLRRAGARCRGDRARQDRHDRIRLLHAGQDRQPAQPGAHARRLVERLRRRGGRSAWRRSPSARRPPAR